MSLALDTQLDALADFAAGLLAKKLVENDPASYKKERVSAQDLKLTELTTPSLADQVRAAEAADIAASAPVPASTTHDAIEKKPETLKKWFEMPATPMTDAIKRDLILLKNRKYLGPKQFYKGNDSKRLPKFFQMGTVIEGNAEPHNRMTNRERREHLVDEFLSDRKATSYTKRKFMEIQTAAASGGRNDYKKIRKARKKHTWRKQH
eukprot:TRINITY_DN40_c0_g1_i1.p2 TRINITY_DN40_c0_g1~~TRINITY_DN40_c0_g1_i1.p2  ORF type:complete len:207 (+),score=35.45 TRINITY_DN40_c0_g1_i1:56-676(+)